MSGGQHNPNARQAPLGSAWNHLQLLGGLQVPYLGRVPQAAHMSSERAAGLTWHTPTMHPYQPSSPDPLQVMKVGGASGNTVFRHTPTPPDRDLPYRHTPTPPDKFYRHTPSPGEVAGGAALPPADIYPIPLPVREKLRSDELAYVRGGVDLSVARESAPRPANGAPLSLSVRDAPTINSLVTRPPRPARVDALLERLAGAEPPPSVIVSPRAAQPSPPDSADDDSCGPPGKRRRKPDRTVRVTGAAPHPPPHAAPHPPPHAATDAPCPLTPPEQRAVANGDASPHHARRKTPAETIDDIAAMIASARPPEPAPLPVSDEPTPTVEVLKSVLGSPEASRAEPPPPAPPAAAPKSPPAPPAPAPVPCDKPEPISPEKKVPKRRSTRSSRSEVSTAETVAEPAQPAAAAPVDKREQRTSSIADVENQLEQMFAGIEEPGEEAPAPATSAQPKEKKKAEKRRRRSWGVKKGVRGRPVSRKPPPPPPPPSSEEQPVTTLKTKAARKTNVKISKKIESRDAYDSGSNASSGRSRGPYIQVRGPSHSPLSVSVVNAPTAGDDDEPKARARREPEFRNGVRKRGLHGSTLGARYDAITADVTWLCAFCERGPHAGVKERLEGPVRPLGDLFGPYALSTDCDEYRALDPSLRRRPGDTDEAWLHEDCALWAPGLLAAGARLSGLEAAVWGARASRCGRCGHAGATVACAARACPARAHVNCARATHWRLFEDDFRALCPRHATV